MDADDDRLAPRRRPSQARSRRTVEWLLEGAARVFRREGWDATTNRIAEEAGVSVGSLYEYFPNKEALLVALATRHVEEAERGIGAVLARSDEGSDDEEPAGGRLGALQAAILASQRFPSHAIALVADPGVSADLADRAATLRRRVIETLTERVRQSQPDVEDPGAAARALFGVVGEQSCRVVFEDPDAGARVAAELLAMAERYLG